MSMFLKKLRKKWDEGKFVCVGLDTDPTKIPESMRRSSVVSSIVKFNQVIVEATKDLVCAYKPNRAFYERFGPNGAFALERTHEVVAEFAPHAVQIDDAKRGDIGNTNSGYIESSFRSLRADAITISPYMGAEEGLQPFLDQKDKGIIVLCRTSNKGAKEFQERHVIVGVDEVRVMNLPRRCVGKTDEEGFFSVPLYQLVAWQVSRHWNQNGNCAVVVGATCPEELAQVRLIVGDMPILIPGIGAQGGDLEKTVLAGKDSRNQGMIINLSRSVLYASAGDDFAQAARKEVQRVHDSITQVLKGGVS